MAKAIETRYAGHRFRSRLEARWAVFFDHLGIQWEYEGEGYELPSGRYLPDFRLEKVAYLGKLDLWCEVKGVARLPDVIKIFRAALELPRHFPGGESPQILVLGQVPRPGRAWAHARMDVRGELVKIQPAYFCRSESGDWRVRTIGEGIWIAAGSVDALETESWGPEYAAVLADLLTDPGYEPSLRVDPDLDGAYRAARSARFEFGESG